MSNATQCTVSFVGQSPTSVNPNSDESIAIGTTLSADACLLSVVETTLSARRSAAVSVAGAGFVWLDLDQQRALVQARDRGALFRAASATAAVSHGLPTISDARWCTIEELLWQIGFHACAERLLDRGHPHDVIELRAWPNLTRLPHGPGAMRLCALLTRSPTTISLAWRMFRIPPQEALQFLSAALAADMIRVVCPHYGSVPQPYLPLQPSAAVQRTAGFWDRLLDRISGL